MTRPLRRDPEDIGAIARFDGYSNRGPRPIDGRLADAMGSIAQSIRSAPPPGVEWVVGWPPRPWNQASREILLYVLTSADSRYSVIKQLARDLSGGFASILILPTIIPLSRAEWIQEVESGLIRYRQIRDRGLLLYDASKGL